MYWLPWAEAIPPRYQNLNVAATRARTPKKHSSFTWADLLVRT